MEIEMISREKIKPKSPAPDHLRIHKISLLDQIILPIYTPVILYFAPDSTSNNVDESIELLKDSLALTLTTFYPYAGVIKDALSVDCNDDGLPFLVTKVKSQMRDFLEHPHTLLIKKFLPSEFSWMEFPGPGSSASMIQLNCFDCGGIALSFIFAHYMADLTSISTFLRAWAANARGTSEVTPLNCIAQSAFPQKVDLPIESNPYNPFMKFLSIGKFVTNRYVFDASSISILKSQTQSTSSNIDFLPTRVDVVTALIWKCFMVAVEEKSGNDHQKPFIITHAVNLRRRAEPPFPENSFGNFLWPTTALCTSHMKRDLKDLVTEVERGTSRIDKEFIKRLQADQGFYQNLEDSRKEIPEEAVFLSFTSWANIGLYDVDFGWGRPIWLSGIVSEDVSETMFPNNIVTLMDTRSGDGIEAWVILDEKYIAGFENNEELQKYARANPSVF